jgi:hypothetical protein
MFEMFINAVSLFLKGRLFRDPSHVLKQSAIGIFATVILAIGLQNLGLSILVSVSLASFGGGLLQPWLFRNLKYA